LEDEKMSQTGTRDQRARSGPIGVAVIGCGSIAHSHFAAWQRLVEVGAARLEIACDNDLARAEAAAARYGARAAATDLEEVVSRPEIHAIETRSARSMSSNPSL